MTTFRDDEASAEDSAPREGIEFRLPIRVIRVSTGLRDIKIDGKSYYAVSSKRGEASVSSTGDPRSMIITLPMGHELCQRYMAGGVPPRQIAVNVWRQQGRSGIAEQIWTGLITSLAPDDNVGSFLVPSRSSESLQRRTPTVTIGRECPHTLYEPNTCRVNQGDFSEDCVVTAVSGNIITVDSVTFPDARAPTGPFLHVASGEQMTVISKVSNVITISLPIYELGIGDAVRISQGCTHQIGGAGGCQQEYENEENYGGMPDLPSSNPFVPNGFGVIQS